MLTKMRNRVIFFIVVPFCLGMENDVSEMSMDYFRHRNVKIICLLKCGEANKGMFYFTKRALQYSITVGSNENCLKSKSSSFGVFIDARCINFQKVITAASKNVMFDSNHKWLINGDNSELVEYHNDTNRIYHGSGNNSPTKTMVLLEKLNISVDADIVVAFKRGDDSYDLYDTFNFGKVQGGHLNIENIGVWHATKGLILNVDINSWKYYRRWNFQQWRMRMGIVNKYPLQEITPEMIIGRLPGPGVAVVTQTSATIIHVIAEIHNFVFDYVFVEKWVGDLAPEHSKKSVVASMFYREHDICPVIRIYPEFFTIFEYLIPAVTSIQTKYYYRIPTQGPGKLENQFLRPLTTSAWFCVGAVIILCIIVLLLSAILERRPEPAQYAIFSVFAVFCQQFFEDWLETGTMIISDARRLTVLVTGLSCVLIYNYYTSSVVSWLLNGPPPSINSLQELLESPLELIYEDIGYSISWLQVPTYYFNIRNAKVEDAMKRKALSAKRNTPLLFPVEDGIEMVRAGGYAYHTEVNTANLLISRKFNMEELCELGSLNSMERTVLVAVLQKNSPYKEFFVWSLLQLKERGISSCIQHRTGTKPVYCKGSTPRALALGGAAPAFLLLAFGYFVATVIMLLERFIYRHIEKKIISF